MTVLLGLIEDKPAIVTLEKLSLSLDRVHNINDLVIEDLKLLDQNDVYYWSVATIKQTIENPAAKVNLIYPATDTHIKKYRQQVKRIVVETPELYTQVVFPYIESMKGDRIKWVYNILHNGVEADRVLVRNDNPVNGYVLLPDLYEIPQDHIQFDLLKLLTENGIARLCLLCT